MSPYEAENTKFLVAFKNGQGAAFHRGGFFIGKKKLKINIYTGFDNSLQMQLKLLSLSYYECMSMRAWTGVNLIKPQTLVKEGAKWWHTPPTCCCLQWISDLSPLRRQQDTRMHAAGGGGGLLSVKLIKMLARHYLQMNSRSDSSAGLAPRTLQRLVSVL